MLKIAVSSLCVLTGASQVAAGEDCMRGLLSEAAKVRGSLRLNFQAAGITIMHDQERALQPLATSARRCLRNRYGPPTKPDEFGAIRYVKGENRCKLTGVVKVGGENLAYMQKYALDLECDTNGKGVEVSGGEEMR